MAATITRNFPGMNITGKTMEELRAAEKLAAEIEAAKKAAAPKRAVSKKLPSLQKRLFDAEGNPSRAVKNQAARARGVYPEDRYTQKGLRKVIKGTLPEHLKDVTEKAPNKSRPPTTGLDRQTEFEKKARRDYGAKSPEKPKGPAANKDTPVSRGKIIQTKQKPSLGSKMRTGLKAGGRMLGPAAAAYAAFEPALTGGLRDIRKSFDDKYSGVVPINEYPEALAQHRTDTAAFNKERGDARALRREELGIPYNEDGEGSISWDAMEKIKGPLPGKKAPVMPVASTQTGWRNPPSEAVAPQRQVVSKPMRRGLTASADGVMRDETGAAYFGDDYLGNIKNKDLRQGIATDLYGRNLLEDPAESARIAAMPPDEIEKQVAARNQVNTDRDARTAAAQNTMTALQRTDPKLASTLIKQQAKQKADRDKRFEASRKEGRKAVQAIGDTEYKIAVAEGLPPRAAAAKADTMRIQYDTVLRRDSSPRMQSTISRVERLRERVAEAAGDARYPYLHDILFGWSSFKDPYDVANPGQTGAVFGSIAAGLARYKNDPTKDTFMLGEDPIDAETMIEDLDEAGVSVEEILDVGGIRLNGRQKYAPSSVWGGGSAYDFIADTHANADR